MATATDSEIQYDEFGEPIPTQEEMDAEQARQEQDRLKKESDTAQTLKLVGAASLLEGQLPNRLPTQAAPVATGPAPMMTNVQPTGGRWTPPSGVAPAVQPGVSAGVAPVEPPTIPVGTTPPIINRGGQPSIGSPTVAAPPAPQGRMYMGPAMSPDQEAAFMQSPAGTRQNLMPGWTPQTWDTATQEGVTRAPSADALANMKRYDAQKSVQLAVSRGMPMSDAIQLYGQGMFPTMQSAPKPMTAYQQTEVDHRKALEEQAKKRGYRQYLDPKTDLESKSLYSEKAMLQGQIASPNTNPKKVPELQTRLDAVNARIKEILPDTPAPASTATGTTLAAPVQRPMPQGRPVKDKSGKTWIYTGTAADPKTDKDPSHWVSP